MGKDHGQSNLEALAQRIDELAREKQKFQDLVEGSMQGIMIHRNFEFLFGNQSLADIFGYDSPDEMREMGDVSKIIAPEELPRLKEMHAARLQGESPPSHYEFQGLRKDGSRIWLEHNSRRIDWEGAQAIQTTLFEISERKSAEEALTSSQRLLKTVLDTIPHWVFVKDRESRFMMVNNAFAASHNAAPEDYIGSHTVEIASGEEEDWRSFLDTDHRVLDDGERVEIPEYSVNLPNGKEEIRRAIKLPLRDEEGTIVGLVGVSEDITEQKRAEAELRESKAVLDIILDNIPSALSVVDGDLNMVVYNRLFTDLLEFPEEQARGWNNFEDFTRYNAERGEYGPGNVEKLVQERVELARKFTAHQFERKRPGGKHLEIRGNPLPGGGFVTIYTDVTERKEAEETLRQREKLLWKHNQALLNLVKRVNVNPANLRETLSEITSVASQTLEVERCGVWVFEEDGANIRCIDLFESNKSLHSEGTVLHADNFPSYFAALREERSIAANDAHHDPRTREFSESYLTPLGISSMMDNPVWVGGKMVGILCHEHVGTPREWSLEEQAFGGSMADLVAMAMESFARRRAEDALITSERSLAVGQQIARLGSWVWEQGPGLAHWSDELYRIIGCEPQEFEGSYDAIVNFVHPDDKEYFSAALKSALRGETPYDFEHRIVRPDGSERHVHELAEVYRDAAGKPTQVVGTIHDITERKIAERALRESELRLRTLMLNIPVILFSLDPEGIIIFSAGKGLSLVRMKPGDLVGRSIFDFVDRYEGIAADIRRAMRGEEVTSERRIGKTVFEFRYTPQRKQGEQLESIIGLAIDVTERKRIEQELAEERRNLEETVVQRTLELKDSLSSLEDSNLRLQESNLAKARFLSSMSHELRTPLNAILGFSELLLGQHFGPLNEKQLNHVKQIDISGKHLLSLISDLLDMVKIDAGGMEVQLEAINVCDFVKSMAEMMDSQFKFKKISLHVTCEARLPLLYADNRKCRQIMLNLLSNAMKFTPEGGETHISAKSIGNASIRISVQDNGIGIENDDIGHIFSKYYQARNVSKEQIGGIGIGLAMTKRLVELHGGRIDVESTAGQGSTFWFELPVREAPQTEAVKQSPEAGTPTQATKVCRILIAEDNEINLALILDILSIQGHETMVARNGLEAIELAKNHGPELILMDIRMPVMDGLEATRKLREIPEFAKIPIIALTASTGSEAEVRQLDAGFTEHLSKPIQASELVATLHRHLN